MHIPAGCNPLCPACAHRSMTSEQSLAQKSDWLSRRLAPWVQSLASPRFVPEARQWAYRDKISLSAQWQEDQWQFGVFRRDEFVAIPDCPIHSLRVTATIALLTRHLPSPEDFQLAFLAQSGAQVVLVLKQSTCPGTEWLTETMIQSLAAIGIEGLWLHCYPAAGRHLFAKNGWHKLWGTERSQDEEGFWYGPGAFSQLLPDLHRESLDEAEDFLSPAAGHHVLDLYCGRGISLKRWLDAGAATLGVELGGEALGCARINAPGAELLRGGCAHRIPQMDAWWKNIAQQQRLVYLNPPRTGLEEAVSHWLAGQARPVRIAYLSCSAGTLARDLEIFCNSGYRMEHITPYDFFPKTYHVETLALLSL